MIQIGTDGGILPQAVVLPNTPVSYVRDEKNDLIVGIDRRTLFLGPAERADVIVDFSNVPDGAKLILYNDAPAPVPSPDPRVDYYTGAEDMTATGGAPSTPPGYGPNTRTIMQLQVEGGGRSKPFDRDALRGVMPAAFAAVQDPIIVPQPAYDAVYGRRFPETYATLNDPALTFAPGDTTIPLTLPLQPKSVQELFDTTYGRLNATLGVELPRSDLSVQTTIPYYYSDPPTEIVRDSLKAAFPRAGDSTQIWKITHNGVDTHVIDFHLFNVQVVNRIGWTGDVRDPDANELGWKSTVRVNPLEVTVLALRPVAPSLPFKLPNSVRLLDPTRPEGSDLGFSGIDPLTGNAIRVTNQRTDFGWEYTWRSHVLDKTDNDMMRPVVLQVAPPSVTRFRARPGDRHGSSLTWSVPLVGPTATEYTIQRATDRFFSEDVERYAIAAPATRFKDVAAAAGATYYYRLRAENASAYSAWSRTAKVTVR
jgi:FtsP/CotA-like multicopper oxidase with cupredoxin domain